MDAKSLIIKPKTVINWHRKGFRLYWTLKSRLDGDKTRIPQELIDLIKQMAEDNPQLGIPRIHDEILKLGLIFPRQPSGGMCQRKTAVRTDKDGKLSTRIMLPELFQSTSFVSRQLVSNCCMYS